MATLESLMTKGIILDRDGTLIDFYRDHERGIVTPAFHPRHMRLLPGVVDGLCKLRDAGFAFAIATNQPDAAKGRLPREAIERTNAALVERLGEHDIVIERLEACLHCPERFDGSDPALTIECDCRKPKPGMLESILSACAWDRDESWMFGDTASDLGASHAASIRFGLLQRPNRCELCVFDQVSLRGVEPALCAATIDALADGVLSR